MRLRIVGGEGGIEMWTLRDAASSEIDGLPTAVSGERPPHPGSHPNGVIGVDHLVVLTADLKRTVAALEGAGVDLRRIRAPEEPGPPLRQAFFRLGEVILEVVESSRAEEGHARFWGITFAVADIDACADSLGERLGEVHDAVQAGRRIATVPREAGLGLPVAMISRN